MLGKFGPGLPATCSCQPACSRLWCACDRHLWPLLPVVLGSTAAACCSIPQARLGACSAPSGGRAASWRSKSSRFPALRSGWLARWPGSASTPWRAATRASLPRWPPTPSGCAPTCGAARSWRGCSGALAGMAAAPGAPPRWAGAPQLYRPGSQARTRPCLPEALPGAPPGGCPEVTLLGAALSLLPLTGRATPM